MIFFRYFPSYWVDQLGFQGGIQRRRAEKNVSLILAYQNYNRNVSNSGNPAPVNQAPAEWVPFRYLCNYTFITIMKKIRCYYWYYMFSFVHMVGLYMHFARLLSPSLFTAYYSFQYFLLLLQPHTEQLFDYHCTCNVLLLIFNRSFSM